MSTRGIIMQILYSDGRFRLITKIAILSKHSEGKCQREVVIFWIRKEQIRRTRVLSLSWSVVSIEGEIWLIVDTRSKHTSRCFYSIICPSYSADVAALWLGDWPEIIQETRWWFHGNRTTHQPQEGQASTARLSSCHCHLLINIYPPFVRPHPFPKPH